MYFVHMLVHRAVRGVHEAFRTETDNVAQPAQR